MNEIVKDIKPEGLKETSQENVDGFIKSVLEDANLDSKQKQEILDRELSKIQAAIQSLEIPKEEKKIMSLDDVKAKMEKAKALKEEQEKREKIVSDFVTNNIRKAETLFFDNREKLNILTNISQTIRNEREKISKMLKEQDENNLIFELKMDFLRDDNMMNEDKETIAFMVGDNENFPKGQKLPLVKKVLGELDKKYEEYDKEISEIEKDRTTGMISSAYKEVYGKDMFNVVPSNDKSAERVDGHIFKNMEGVIKSIKNDFEVQKKEIFSAETKQEVK